MRTEGLDDSVWENWIGVLCRTGAIWKNALQEDYAKKTHTIWKNALQKDWTTAFGKTE